MNKYTMKDFDKEFPNNASCLEWIKNHRWPNGIPCRKCERLTKHHRVLKRSCYECDACGTQVYPTAGTIFHKSTTPLRIWFQAIYRMASTRCGISAKQIQRETGVTYKTAWRMFHQIRSILGEDIERLDGEVEIDETYIGGRSHGKRGRGAYGKSIVAGIAQRKGKLTATKVPDVKARTLIPMIQRRVSRKALVHTDEMTSYNKLSHAGYNHRQVLHGAKMYVIGDAHTNTIDGFWSLVKRSINGAYHSISHQYLPLYLNEFVFRYNHRNDEVPMFKAFLDRVRAAQT